MSTINVRSFGAQPDGVTKCTAALQKAIEVCASEGGGTVLVPGGHYLTGAIQLRSHINLQLENGAILLFSNEPADFQTVPTRWGGVECHGYSPCIYGWNLENVSLSGGGTLDGQGQWWWDRYNDLHMGRDVPNDRELEFKELNRHLGLTEIEWPYVEWQLQHLRPPLVQLMHCRNIKLEGLTHQNSPFWNTHLVYCDNVTVRGVTFRNPPNAPNGDGLDIDSSTNIRVSDCYFDVNDDCLCLKSGIDRDGRRVNRPTENVTISNCTMLRGHGGVVFGSEIAGDIRNVCISNCIFIGTERGIRIKANRARGGVVEDLLIANILMKNVWCPFIINSYYVCGHDSEDETLFGFAAQPVTERTPVFRRIRIQNLTARGVTCAAGYVLGLPESPVTGLVLDNVEIETIQDPDAELVEIDAVPRRDNNHLMAAEGIYARFVKDFRLRNVRIQPRQGPALQIENSEDVAAYNFETNLPGPTEEAMIFNDVAHLVILPQSACLENS